MTWFLVNPAEQENYTGVALVAKAEKKQVKRIILTRPAVEAEALRFFPGDLNEKLDPYMVPLYDA